MRILTVDDEESMQGIFRLLLREHELVQVSDAEAAFKEITAESFDLILLDHMLPGMSGLSLLEKTRSLGKETPVVIVSGSAGVIKERALKLGAIGLIQKPFGCEELLGVINGLRGASPA